MQLRCLVLEQKLATMTRKFSSESYIFKTQRRRDAKIIFEHEKHGDLSKPH